MNLDQLLRDSAPDSDEMHRETRRMRTRVVAQFQATEVQRPHHRGRWAAGVLAAAAAAAAYVVVSPGGPAVSPAYAIDKQADGDIIVTIHRLEDAAGLEAALAEHGIDANVAFEPATRDDTRYVTSPKRSDTQTGPSRVPERVPTTALGCEWGGAAPATLTRSGEAWVLEIPARSPLHDHPVGMTTGPQGELTVAYESEEPGTYCLVR